MGHKVNPTGIRLGVIKEHNSVWYAEKKEYANNLLNDIQVREFLDKRLEKASVSKIVIERRLRTPGSRFILPVPVLLSVRRVKMLTVCVAKSAT